MAAEFPNNVLLLRLTDISVSIPLKKNFELKC